MKWIYAAALSALLLTGCAAQPAQEAGSGSGTAAEQNIIVTSVPRETMETFGGCSSLRLPGNLIAAAATGVRYESAAEQTEFYGSSDDAWQRLLNGELDLVLAYAPGDTAAQQLEEAGVRTQEVGYDALVLLAGGAQETRSLTCEQIRTAFETTQTEEWTCYTAKLGTTSRMLATRLFGEGFGGVSVIEGDDTLTAACPHTEGTLCYTTFLHVQETALPENTTMVAVDGILPDAQTVITGESAMQYPLRVPYVIGCRKGLADNDPAMLVYRWLTSADGMQWLEQATAQNPT